MYENIIGQERIVSQLSSEILSDTLPSSILFYGEPYSGKLSTALETARILTCEKKAALWNCSCISCVRHRLLLHPYMLILGSRYFTQEIAASADTLVRTGKDSARYLFIRAVRKLIRRFDPVLWEGEESKLQKVQPLIQSVEDRIVELYPDRELPGETKLKKAVDTICEECGKISSGGVPDSIPVNMIRRVSYWAHVSSPAEKKVIILERADRMQDSSRNALLKILEEPPAGVHFILLSERRSTVMPTILSRVRGYYFQDRSDTTADEIMRKIFREESGIYKNLRRFFSIWKGIDPELLENVASRFLSAVITGNGPQDPEGINILQEIHETLGSLSDGESFQYFLEEVTRQMRNIVRGEGRDGIRAPVSKLEVWNGIVKKASRENAELNISASLLLETMLYSMRGHA